MACTHCHKRKVRCVFNEDSNQCDRCLGKQLCCVPHESQQGRRADLDTEEASHKSSNRNHNDAFPSKGGDSLDFDASFHILSVFSQGTRGLWSISNSTTLAHHVISSRIAMPKDGISTYIMCSCVSSLPQGANSCLGVFKKKLDSSDVWHLAVVESFFYLNHDGNDIVHLLEWTGSISSDGSPDFYNSTTSENFRTHFTKRIFNLGDIDFVFVNKVRGNTFPNVTIPDSTRSNKDGGIQCNPNGPDRVPKNLAIAVDRKRDGNASLSTSTLSISSEVEPFFEKVNKSNLQQRLRKKLKRSQTFKLLQAWTSPLPRKPRDDAHVCVVTVSKSNGEYLTPVDIRSLGDAEGLFFFPSLPTGDESRPNVQTFFGISQSDYSHVKDSINGISPSQANKMLSQHSKCSHVLCNATSLHQSDMYRYTKVFLSSDVTPTAAVQPGSSTIDLPEIDRQINYTVDCARRYSDHIPLSAAIVDPTLHDVTINNSIIQRIIIAVDKNGLFTGLLNMDLYRTSEKRRINTVAQPNPSEGDMSSFWYWYFRKHKYVSGATVAEGN